MHIWTRQMTVSVSVCLRFRACVSNCTLTVFGALPVFWGAEVGGFSSWACWRVESLSYRVMEASEASQHSSQTEMIKPAAVTQRKPIGLAEQQGKKGELLERSHWRREWGITVQQSYNKDKMIFQDRCWKWSLMSAVTENGLVVLRVKVSPVDLYLSTESAAGCPFLKLGLELRGHDLDLVLLQLSTLRC